MHKCFGWLSNQLTGSVWAQVCLRVWERGEFVGAGGLVINTYLMLGIANEPARIAKRQSVSSSVL